jgi:Tol biopolymer transport system component
MAPEQAAADPHTDHRADLYAFGVMAYEMLTGQPPFVGATPQAVLSAHVTEPPVAVTQRRPTIPPPLAQLIMRCLAKKPADRPQTAEELLPVLEVLATPSGGITPTDTQPVQMVHGARGRRRVTAAVGVALAVVAVGLLAPQVLGPRPLKITLSDITPVTTEPGVEYQPALSPDGKEVAYTVGPLGAIATSHLVIRSTVNVAGSGEVRLAGTSFQMQAFPAWSPGGDFVRFLGCSPGEHGGFPCVWSETGKLGGAVRSLALPARAREFSRWPSWSPDGARVAFVKGDTILISSAADTTPRLVAVHTAKYEALHSLAWSPDGMLIAYVNGNPGWLVSGNVSGASIWIVNAAGGEPQRVTTADYLNVSPAWLDARHLLFVSNRDGPRAVYVVGVRARGRRGEPQAVPGVADPHSISYSISARKLAYSKFTLRQNIWSYPLGRSAPVSIRDGTPVTIGSQVIEEHDVSSDGRWLVFDSNRRGNMDLYKIPLRGGEAVPLTDFPGDEFQPRWSPDGREVAFYAVTPGSVGICQLMVMPAAGGPPSPLTSSPGFNNMPAWSPSGLSIAFESTRTGSNRIWLLTRDSVGGAWREPVRLTDFSCGLSGWAPDGGGVLCDAGRDLVFVSPKGLVLWRRNLVPTGGLAGYGTAGYSRDGRTIYVWGDHRDGRRGVWAIPVAGGPPRLVIVWDDPTLTVPGLTNPFRPDVGPDRIYLTVAQHESDIWVANLHW